MRKITDIIIHCSATKEGRDFDVEDVRNWHVKGNKWNDVGYHYVIKLDGTIEIGRPIDKMGAHCKGHNRNSIGICYAGGMGMDLKSWKDTRTPEQIESLKSLVNALKTCFNIQKVSGHNEYTSSKICPCFNVKKEFINN